jgi:hypothetical protein
MRCDYRASQNNRDADKNLLPDQVGVSLKAPEFITGWTYLNSVSSQRLALLKKLISSAD